MTRRSIAASLLFVLTLAAPAVSRDVDISLDVSPSFRIDNFKWSIAGDANGANPNILSELTWRSLKIQEIRLEGRLYKANDFVFQVFWAGGRIISGENQDSDYDGNNRTYEWSRSNNTTDMGDTRDIRLGAGLPIRNPSADEVTPMVGWAYSSERLFITDGYQTIYVVSWIPYVALPPGSFYGFNSHYEHKWKGMWMGVESETYFADKLKVTGVLRYYPRLSYSAEADWNLRSEFAHPKSYEHWATGNGWDVELSFLHELDRNVEAGLGLNWRGWRASNGVDRTFSSSGTPYADQRLNEVRWNTFSVNVRFRFRSLLNTRPPFPF